LAKTIVLFYLAQVIILPKSKEYRLLKGALFAFVVLSMAAATKKEKKRRNLPLEEALVAGT
jgi:hypothetical protein